MDIIWHIWDTHMHKNQQRPSLVRCYSGGVSCQIKCPTGGAECCFDRPAYTDHVNNFEINRCCNNPGIMRNNLVAIIDLERSVWGSSEPLKIWISLTRQLYKLFFSVVAVTLVKKIWWWEKTPPVEGLPPGRTHPPPPGVSSPHRDGYHSSLWKFSCQCCQKTGTKTVVASLHLYWMDPPEL